jgi:hypothetical protein
MLKTLGRILMQPDTEDLELLCLWISTRRVFSSSKTPHVFTLGWKHIQFPKRVFLRIMGKNRGQEQRNRQQA